ncbi:hypothetical protein GF325_19345 [Candidatus Bathyarchaeota archaeon]|nr:hypothetical protein [Candidatus Bathyarchaeota archaeon]
MSKEKFVRNKPHVNVGLVAVVIITGLSCGMVIYQDIAKLLDGDGDSVPDNREARMQIPLYFESSGDSLLYQTYETVNGSTPVHHEPGHDLTISHATGTMHLQLHWNQYADVSTGIPKVKFSWIYDSLVEFMDVDANGLFEPAFDSVVAHTSLDNWTRTGFGHGVDGEPVFHSSYLTGDGVLEATFYTTEEHVLLSRGIGLLEPGDLKSILEFTDFVPITGGTKLALNLSIQSDRDLQFSSAGVTVSNGSFGAEYMWPRWIVRDGVNGSVNVTMPLPGAPVKEADVYLNLGMFSSATVDPHFRIFRRRDNVSLIDLPWTYIALGSVTLLGIGITSQKTKKRPGRVKYGDITLKKGYTPETSGKGDGTSGMEKKALKHGGTVKVDVEKSAFKKAEIQLQGEAEVDAEKRIPDRLGHKERAISIDESKPRMNKSELIENLAEKTTGEKSPADNEGKMKESKEK